MSAKAKSAPGRGPISRVSGVASDYSSTTPASGTTAVTPESIPDELKLYPHWVVWKYVPKPGKKPDKVPYSPISGARTSHSPTASGEWGTFEQALEAYNKRYSNWSGLGYVFSPEDPFTGIDFDGAPDQLAWIERFDSYAEYSPSGQQGVHGIIRGSLMGPGRKHDGHEVYSTHRFFTMTGNQVPGSQDTINGRQKVLSEFVESVFPAEQPRNAAPAGISHLQDDQLIEKIRASKQGSKFDRLMSGDISGHPVEGHSGADGSITMLLSFWTNRDPAQMDRIFRRSGLMRPKWDEMRGAETYGDYTIRRAIEKTPEGYEPAGGAISSYGTRAKDDRDGATFEGLDSCNKRVAELEAENRTLRTENVRLKHVENLYSLQWQVWGNPDISGTEKAVAMATLSVVEHAPKDRRDEKGRVATWRSEIARKAGVSEDTASRTLKKGVLADAGLFELDVETVRVERPDPRTGEIRAMPTQQWYIRATAEPVELLERMRTIRKAEDAPTHGGAHAKGCPDHPNTPVRVTTITVHECSVCDRMLDRNRTTHNIIPDMPVDDDYLLEEGASALWQQDAAVESDPSQTVDSLYTRQVAAIGTADVRPQDAATVQVPQRKRQPHKDEVYNPFLAGGHGD